MIHPATDNQGKFSLQLIYEDDRKEIAVSEQIEITWERGIKLLVQNIKFHKATDKITCDVINEGTESVKELKIWYPSKTNGVSLNGQPFDGIKELLIGNLGMAERKENIDLGKLNFAKQKNLQCDFWFTYTGGSTEANKQSETFTTSETILKFAKLT
jgi:hypothetical protein